MISNSPRATIFNIMRFAVHDGPGIRTAVFFKGCPLSCRWCHNPESQNFAPEVLYSVERCRLCGACAAACPHQAILRRPDRMETTAACERCGTCLDFCAAEARAIAGREVSAVEILKEIERDTVFFDESGGGVTFTGGEPLAQPAALEALLRGCRERRIHTAIETCGAAGRDSLLRLCGLADLLLFDIKMADEERHHRYTGATNRNILENLAVLAAVHRNVIARVPVIPGVNDDSGEIDRLCSLLRRMAVRRVDLLPYHRAGMEKYRRLGREYGLPETLPPAEAELARLAARMAAAGIPARVAG
ncbi:MAG TPA: glycyl-radical enzyme activating protein [Verrucomicrobiae bacterium]|nr:glycyl-radical enzyme activating protein [Verrucomicrobiae bacterium]